MRIGFLALLLIPVAGTAQAQAQAQPVQSPFQRPMETTPPSPLDLVPDKVAKPLASQGDNRIVSKNEAYNVARASEGRVGVRLGNDMSFRVTGN